MDREILFKAKRIDNGEWVEGYIYKINNYAFIFPLKTNGSYDVSKNVMKFINPCFEVDTSTICQYIGFTDKNGNKIWENDIIQHTDDLIGIIKKDLIVWNTNFFAFSRKRKCNYELGFQYLWISEQQAKESEVVGNIFDNPELL